MTFLVNMTLKIKPEKDLCLHCTHAAIFSQGVRKYDPNICGLNAVKISIYVIDNDSQLVDNDRNNEGAKDTLFRGA